MAGMAVVAIPAIPEGWHGRDLVRIVDPLGCVAAWIAPGLAGVVVGCHARLSNSGPWRAIALANPRDGMFAFEPIVTADDGTVTPVRMLGTGWLLVERDPTGAVVQGQLDESTVRIATQCEDGGLRLGIEMKRRAAESKVAFYLPPIQERPLGTLGLDIAEETSGTWRKLAIDFRLAESAE